MFRQTPAAGAPATCPIPASAGIGLRFPHHGEVLAGASQASWFEAHAENYLSGIAAKTLLQVREAYPVSLHAIGLSLGSVEGVDSDHLQVIADLAARVAPGLISDHLSWSSVGGVHLPDLLPVPYTDEALDVFVRNIDRVQLALQRTILIENPSVYFAFGGADWSESGFIAELARRTGCGVLLDVNNVFVSAFNLGEDPIDRLDRLLADLPAAAIGEIHLAGHAVQTLSDEKVVRIDDHGSPVSAEVMALYARALDVIGPRPTLIEWDTDVPSLEVLDEERAKIQSALVQAEPSAGRPRYAGAR